MLLVYKGFFLKVIFRIFREFFFWVIKFILNLLIGEGNKIIFVIFESFILEDINLVEVYKIICN